MSVVIPTFNLGRYVAAAVRSVLEQTVRPEEVIVVDDGSTDDTETALAQFGDAITAVKQPNSGVSVARNRGAEIARGRFVAFLDADDEWLPSKLERQLAGLAARPEAIASFAETLLADERTGRTGRVRYRNEPDMVRVLLLAGCVIGNNSSVLVERRTFLDAGGYDPRMSQSADWDMWLRLAERGSFDLVDEPLVRYRVHSANMSRNIGLLERDNLRVLEKFYASPERRARYGPYRRSAFAHNYVVLAASYLHAGDLRSGLRCAARAFQHSPREAARLLSWPSRALRRLRRAARSSS